MKSNPTFKPQNYWGPRGKVPWADKLMVKLQKIDYPEIQKEGITKVQLMARNLIKLSSVMTDQQFQNSDYVYNAILVLAGSVYKLDQKTILEFGNAFHIPKNDKGFFKSQLYRKMLKSVEAINRMKDQTEIWNFILQDDQFEIRDTKNHFREFSKLCREIGLPVCKVK